MIASPSTRKMSIVHQQRDDYEKKILGAAVSPAAAHRTIYDCREPRHDRDVPAVTEFCDAANNAEEIPNQAT